MNKMISYPIGAEQFTRIYVHGDFLALFRDSRIDRPILEDRKVERKKIELGSYMPGSRDYVPMTYPINTTSSSSGGIRA